MAGSVTPQSEWGAAANRARRLGASFSIRGGGDAVRRAAGEGGADPGTPLGPDEVARLAALVREAVRGRALARVARLANHDLRTPLNTTVLEIELLRARLQDAGPPDGAERSLSAIAAGVRGAAGLLDDWAALLLAPREQERAHSADQPLCEAVVGVLPGFVAAGAALEVVLDERSPRRDGRPGPLREALVQSMFAALDGGARSVRVEMRAAGAAVTYAVRPADGAAAPPRPAAADAAPRPAWRDGQPHALERAAAAAFAADAGAVYAEDGAGVVLRCAGE